MFLLLLLFGSAHYQQIQRINIGTTVASKLFKLCNAMCNRAQTYKILEYIFDLTEGKRFLDIKLKTVLERLWNDVTRKPD